MSRIEYAILIDDDKTTNFLNKYLMLKSKRFNIIESYINSIQVLEKFANDIRFEPDVIFLDIEMINMTGWDVLNQFEKLYASRVKTKIFFLTSSTDEEDIGKFTPNEFALEYLIKPLSIDVIESIYCKYF